MKYLCRTLVVVCLFPACEGGVSLCAPQTKTVESTKSERAKTALEHEPVTEAFGLMLGARFEPELVKRVISQGPKTYVDSDKQKKTGTRYLVEPTQPDSHFTSYGVETTEDGFIHAIRGDFVSPEKKNVCAISKKLAASLTKKYGKPRGTGHGGAWYAFRDMSVKHYRGIRLYANRCRRGIYEIVYGDDSAKKSAAARASSGAEPSSPDG